MLLFASLLVAPADAAPPSRYSKCSSTTGATSYATSAECTCLKASSKSADWWGTSAGGAAANILAGDKPWDVPVGTCFEISAYLTGYDPRTERALLSYGRNITWNETTNLITGSKTGSYHFDTAYPEQIVWAEHESIDNTPPPIIALPMNPYDWFFVDEEGNVVGSMMGNGSTVTHAVMTDLDDNGLPDITVVFENGDVWELPDVQDPYDMYMAPQGPLPSP